MQQRVDLPVILDAIMLQLYHCHLNAWPQLLTMTVYSTWHPDNSRNVKFRNCLMNVRHMCYTFHIRRIMYLTNSMAIHWLI